MGDEIPEELRNSPSACKFFFGDMNEEEKRKHVKLLQKCMKALVDNGGTYNGVDDEALKEQIKSLTIATDKSSSPEDETTVVNCLSEEIFLFTLSENPRSFTNGSNVTHLLHLKELASSLHPIKTIDLEILEQALFERLLVEDPGSCVINNSKSKSRIDVENPPLHVIEKECVTYLFNCYMLILQKKNEFNPGKATFNILPALETMTNLIIRNVATALKQPELYEESKQELNKQIVSLFSLEEYDAVNLTEFFTLVAKEVEKDEPPGTLLRAFTPTFDLVHKDLAQASILTFPKSHFLLLKIFSTIPLIANVLLIHSTPKDTKLGVAFANTLLGSAFRLSCLPKTPDGMYEYFYKQLSQDVNFNAVEQHLWTSLDLLTELLHGVFLSLLKTCRNQTLNWIGACLDANIHRGKLSAIAAYTPAVFACVSDGFALNLSSVLLRLAEPFIADCDSPKLLRIDPTYTAFMMEDEAAANNSGVHMKSLSSETCLLPVEEGNSRPCAKKFSFITECFYMAHRSLDIGLRVVLEHMLSIYKEFVKLQNSMRDAAGQGRSDLSEAIREQMEVIFPRYMSMRCALLEPKNLQLIGKFLSATSIWLIQVVVDNNTDYTRESFAPISKKTLSFPLPDHIPDTLKCIPEILLENTASFLVLLKRFATNSFESAFYTVGTDNLQPVLTMLLVFMSSNKRARNPHLRARLAECLECLLPHENETSVLGTYFRSALFKEHPYRKEIVRCLLDVFVGIEMTGESVSFEQKFNYRRPMYAVMSYLWDIPEHKEQFKELSKEAEETMEAVTPPLFLRFLNLLMNDAIFLLDEALTNMAQLRTMQTARENGEWDNLPANERERNNVLLQHIGMTARIDNILGQETIQALEYLSSEIKSIFCHPTMSDRVAAMLNYFLVHLVGPKKKNFKVKDQKEYKFEPATIVINICKIYTHLSDSNEFCAAVSRDGRSYSPQLFQQAQDVLARIGGSALIGDMMTTAERVQKLADILKAEEEVLSDIPDEFLDPIMSTLMSDPVTLPSSRITLDRSTIARHLLSDQSDPFNRSLLTMDMVTSNTELKEKIDKWLKEKKRSHSLMSSNIKDTQPDEPSTSQ